MTKTSVAHKIVAPEPGASALQRFLSGASLVLIGGFAGQVMQSLPIISTFCGLIASSALFGLSHTWHLLRGALRVTASLVFAATVIVSTYLGVQEYTGANYPLQYQVCGTATLSNGYVDGIVFGLEWVNPNNKSVWVHLDKHELTAGDRRSKLPAPDITVEVKPQNAGQGNAKSDDSVDFDPPLTPRSMTGSVHQEFKLGPDKDHLRRTFVIDGFFELDLADTPDGPHYVFRYSPTSKGTSGYVGECDIGPHIEAQLIPQV